jgi:hypothetical protein
VTITNSELSASDPDDGDTGIKFVIKSIPSYGSLQLSSSTMSVNDTLTLDDIKNNRVTYVHNNSGESASDQFGFDVQDGLEDGVSAINGQTFTISIDLLPVISSGQSFAYAAGQSSGATLGTVSATDNLGVTGFSINSVMGSDEQSYISQGWFAISSAGVVSLTSAGAGEVAANSATIAPNIFTLSITAEDAGGNSDTESITLSVDGAAPVIVAGQSLS